MKRLMLVFIMMAFLGCTTVTYAKEQAFWNSNYECEGFSSAEEAAATYIEALNDGDVPKMISCFAIETYVDNVNRLATIERLYAFAPTSFDTFPMPTDYMRDLLVAERYGSIARQLCYQYLVFAWPEDYDSYSGKPVRFMPDENGKSEEAGIFLNAFANSEFNKWIGNIEFVAFENVENLRAHELFETEANQRNIQRQAACRGCDEIRNMILRIRVDGTDYFQFLECAQYEGRWYVQNIGVNIANLTGLNSDCGGLVIAGMVS